MDTNECDKAVNRLVWWVGCLGGAARMQVSKSTGVGKVWKSGYPEHYVQSGCDCV